MDAIHPYQIYRTEVSLALQSKKEEFNLLGYPDITEEDIWLYLTNKKWKKPQEGTRQYEIIQDIMSVKIADYMNYVTVEALIEGDAMKKNLGQNFEQFKDLFS